MSFDAIITDPPYGTKTASWDKEPEIEIWAELQQLCPAGPIAIFGYAQQLFRWSQFLDGLQLIGYIVWHKYNELLIGPGLTRAHEDIALWGDSASQVRSDKVREPYSKDDSLIKFYNSLNRKKRPNAKTARLSQGREQQHSNGRRCSDLWRIPAPGHGFNSHLRNHPNEKPLEVMNRLCCLLTEPGQKILDCYMGSGTTLVAAQQLGRQAVGIDITEKYCEIAVKRLRQPAFWSIISVPPSMPRPEQAEMEL